MPVFSVFINELSADSQFNGHPWSEGLTELFHCLDLFRGQVGVKGYYCSDIYNRPFLFDHSPLSSVLKRNPDYQKKFKKYLNSFTVLRSEDEKKEMLNSGNNIVNLHFQYGPIQENIKTCDFLSSDTLLLYLKERGHIKPVYNPLSSVPPRDDETILADISLFSETRHSYQRRKMYRRNGTSELWYVDNCHFGEDAHIEVFNENTKKQIHVSRIDRIDFFRDLTEAEKSRTLCFDDGR